MFSSVGWWSRRIPRVWYLHVNTRGVSILGASCHHTLGIVPRCPDPADPRLQTFLVLNKLHRSEALKHVSCCWCHLPLTSLCPSGAGGREVRQHPSAGGGGISGVWDDLRRCGGGGTGHTHLGGVVLQGWKLGAARILPQTQSPNAQELPELCESKATENHSSNKMLQLTRIKNVQKNKIYKIEWKLNEIKIIGNIHIYYTYNNIYYV